MFILSMTSWIKRINNTNLPILLNHYCNLESPIPFKVVLVLSTDELANTNINKDIFIKNDKFEIIWTKENTKAYKKYFPTKMKYPNDIIITVDDDEIPKQDFFYKIYEIYKIDNKRIIYGYDLKPFYKPRFRKGSIEYVRYAIGVYPPNTLYDLDESIGIKYFKEMDDEYMSMLGVLAGSDYFDISCRDLLQPQAFAQNIGMGLLYSSQIQENSIKLCRDSFFRDFPYLKNIYDENRKKDHVCLK